jgi:hypothetical protein
MANAVAQEKRFFHWFLEFPEVFAEMDTERSGSGGFDCILGNPPFLGGKKISGNFGDSYLNCIKINFQPAEGGLDLVTYFFRRIFSIIAQSGFQSLISTKTIYQGDSRIGGLEFILDNGGSINHAIRLMTWPGRAAVEISIISINKDHGKIKNILDNKEVFQITSRLDTNTESSNNPIVLNDNIQKSFIGSVINGIGFILNENEKDKFEKNVVMPYLSGDDINNDIYQRATRYIINFRDWTEQYCKENYPIAYDKILKTVKPQRDLVNRESYKKLWWQYAEKCSDLYKRIEFIDNVLVLPRVSKYLNLSIVTNNQVFMDKVVVFALEAKKKYIYLQNSIFDFWAWKYSSTLGSSTINFRPTEAFQTFPFPQHLTATQEQNLEVLGEAYHEHRRQLMLKMQLGLTKTYNAFHAREIQESGASRQDLEGLDKKMIEKQYGKEMWNLWNHLQKNEGTCSIEEAVTGIVELRRLHVLMDEAVLEAYGWTDVKLRHDFYEVDYLPVNDRVRYTIHPEARKEILKRLLELNHKIHGEEVAARLWDKNKTTAKKASKFSGVVKEPEVGYGGLFDNITNEK